MDENKQISLLSGDETALSTEDIYPKTSFDSLDAARDVALTCTKCPLCETRTNVVFSRGNPNALIMIIGEGPGQNEDETGMPFVGRAGQLLDKIFESVGLSTEEDVYICNIVKCRPPNNRVPTPMETESCRDYLNAQIRYVKPKIILLTGATAMKGILDIKTGITKVRGQWYKDVYGAMVMPIFHPAYLLRNQSKKEGSPKWLMWQDVKEIKSQLEKLKG